MIMIQTRFLLAMGLVLVIGCSGGGGEAIDGGDEVASSAGTSGRFDVGGHDLHLESRGAGEPVIVVDTGFGNPSETWRYIQEALAESAQVVLYDRAGYGNSDPGPLPRDADRIVGELARLLEVAEISPPYVLVGHSLGGLHVLHYAARYPSRTAALVLLDPAPMPALVSERYPGLFAMMDSVTRELEAIADGLEQSDRADDLARAPFQRTLASEHRMLIGRDGEILAEDSLDPGIPVVVIASEVPNPAFGDSAAAFQSFWIQESRALALSSFKGRFLLAIGSGHHIHQDAPDLVIDVIEELLDQLAATE